MTREEFTQMMSEFESRIVNAIRSSLTTSESAPTKIYNEWLSIDEAVDFLRTVGYPTTKKYIYLLRHKNAIPYARCNGKLSFNREALRGWASEQRTFDSEQSRRNAAETLAENAKRHERSQIKIA